MREITVKIGLERIDMVVVRGAGQGMGAVTTLS